MTISKPYMEDHHGSAQSIPRRKMLFVVGAFLLCAIVIALLMVRKDIIPIGGLRATPTPAAQSRPAIDGTMFLASTQNKKVFGVGEEIVLDLRIDTVRKEIGGYDAVLIYDSSQLEFVTATNLVKNFEVFSNIAPPTSGTENTLTITGIMQFDAQTPYAFHQDPVARLEFKAKKTGPAKISFMFTKGETNDSNLVLIDTQEILGAVKDFSFTVANAKKLSVGQSYTEPQSSLKIKVDKITVPPANCNDCITEAMLSISLKGNTQSATFSSGGIAGKMVDSQNIMGFMIEVENITETSLQVAVVPAE